MLAPRRFERRVGAAGNAALIAALVFFATLAYWQVFRADLAVHAGNPRILASFNDPGRGAILARDGTVLARSRPDGTREYTSTIFAHAIGYLDARYGTQGTELAFNDVLTGQAGGTFDDAVNAELTRRAREGLDVRLTLDPKLQAVAAAALGDRRGAVIAIDPRNGEVLAMANVPAYDPATIATDGAALLADERSPLLNRATQGNYPPGSTFKTVTAISALENHIITPETMVTCPGEIVIDGFPISCRNTAQGVGTYTFKDAYARSVNAIFAQVGVSLGWGFLTRTAEALGFGGAVDFTIETAPTQLHAPGSAESQVLLATTAFGQGELLATPLQMAMVAAAVANGGVLATPHLGLSAGKGGKTSLNLAPGGSRRVISPSVAETMRQFMVAAVGDSQAAGISIPGVTVAGKTGTAEAGSGTAHAWFIAFAPAEAPTIAIAVIVEHGGQGGAVAAPVAGQVLRAALAP
ncbi:MAG: hypothetical protein HY875_06360 [Chloroflexi bacterium]|nr:hypothetical protein [Chloroflexota bacterium]